MNKKALLYAHSKCKSDRINLASVVRIITKDDNYDRDYTDTEQFEVEYYYETFVH